jgi:hypothetical protein
MTTDNATPVSDQLLAFFKLLCDADRLKIIGLLAHGARPIEAITADIGGNPTDVARHLKLLCASGLVAEQERGVFTLQEKRLEQMAHTVLGGSRPSAPPVEEGDAFERKVLHDFCLPDGRLKRLPSQLKKQMVLLRYVNAVFQPGVQYTEKQVNVALSRFHEDTATLRRALVDHRLMARGNGIYWQVDANDIKESPTT